MSNERRKNPGRPVSDTIYYCYNKNIKKWKFALYPLFEMLYNTRTRIRHICIIIIDIYTYRADDEIPI